MHSPFVEMLRDVIARGAATGDFPHFVDPVQLYISIASLSYFYIGNSATLSVIFGRDLLDDEARHERLTHMTSLVLGALAHRRVPARPRQERKSTPVRTAAPVDAEA